VETDHVRQVFWATVGIASAVIVLLACSPAGASSRAPRGQIYRVWLDGHATRLHLGPAAGTNLAVSPNGKEVASLHTSCSFNESLYVATIDRSSVSRWSACLRGIQGYGLSWSPDSQRVAVTTNNPFTGGAGLGRLYLLGPGRQRLLARVHGGIDSPVWSPNGKVMTFDETHLANTPAAGTYVTGRFVTAITPRGQRVWRVRGLLGAHAWSRRGFVKLFLRRGPFGRPWIRIYRAAGRFASAFAGRTAAWSPAGDRIAVLVANRLEIRTPAGRVVFKRRFADLHLKQYAAVEPKEGNGLRWLNARQVLISWTAGGTQVARPLAVNIVDGALSRLSRSSAVGFLSPNRRLLAHVAYRFRNGMPDAIALRVNKPDGSHARALVPFAPCPDLNGAHVAWLPDAKSLLYQFAC
jgi:hypothetical protein